MQRASLRLTWRNHVIPIIVEHVNFNKWALLVSEASEQRCETFETRDALVGPPEVRFESVRAGGSQECEGKWDELPEIGESRSVDWIL